MGVAVVVVVVVVVVAVLVITNSSRRCRCRSRSRSRSRRREGANVPGFRAPVFDWGRGRTPIPANVALPLLWCKERRSKCARFSGTFSLSVHWV